MNILLTVPTWNEELVIARNLALLQEAVLRYLPEHDATIEVADNGSTDRTIDRIVGAIHELPLQVFQLDERGKGLAVRRSWERHLADMDILIFTDADLAADLSALPPFIQPIARGEADIVCASRFLKGSETERAPSREAASRLYRLFQRAILHLPVKDAQCGLKAISAAAARELLPKCQEKGWMFDSELLAFASRGGFRVLEVPVRWVEHRDPRRRSAIRLFQHGWGFILGLLRIRKRLSKTIDKTAIL